MQQFYGAIEAGGTKFVCAVGTAEGELVAETRFPTQGPAETLAQAVQFFQAAPGPLAGLGIGAFGPLDLNPTSPTFGFITSTPKPGWPYTDIAGALGRSLGVPVFIDTDVNAAAVGEHRWGAGQGFDTFIYVTIGTGIGGGVVVNGQPLHGLVHPEMGHILIPHDRQADPYGGFCPFHGDCFEGLAAGPAILGRWGQAGDTLPPDHPAWALEAGYIAAALANYTLTLSPQRLILGGGVMQQAHLLPLIRAKTQALLNGYVAADSITQDIDNFIVPPGLGTRAGILGALALAV